MAPTLKEILEEPGEPLAEDPELYDLNTDWELLFRKQRAQAKAKKRSSYGRPAK